MTVNGFQLAMVRGDSESIRVSCSTPFASGDQVYFTVRRNVEAPIELQKIVTEFADGKAYVIIDPTDTETMDFGDYVYDVQVIWASGAVKTVVKKNTFRVEEEVTY